MGRLRILGLAALVATGCAKIIGVPDLTYDPAADAGRPADGSTPLGDATTPPGDDGGNACGAILASDGHNCGRCGRECGAGQCTNGACQPFVIASGINGLTQHTLGSDGYVYFAASVDDLVRRAKKDGTGTPETVVSNANGPIGIALQGPTLYFTNDDGLHKVSVGAPGTGLATVKSLFLARYIDVLGTSLIVPTQDKIYRFQNDTELGIVAGSDEDGLQNWFATQSASWVYYTSEETGIYRGLVDGGGATTPLEVESTDSPTRPALVAVNGDRFFWAYFSDQGKNGVVASATEADPATRITYTMTGIYPIGIAADANYVYWSDRGNVVGDAFSAASGDGKLYACPRAGCAAAPITLADGLTGAGYIVLDDGFVYFAENNNFNSGGRIRAVAKP